MTATQFAFLEERLSGFRGEYLEQIDRNLPDLLTTFDAQVLGGYSRETEERFKTHEGYAMVSDCHIFTGKQDRPVYERLSSALGKLQGEARQAFLYGLRKALVTAQDFVTAQDNKMDSLQKSAEALVEAGSPEFVSNLVLGLSHDQLMRLRGASSGYRDIYRVMVDAVRQALPK